MEILLYFLFAGLIVCGITYLVRRMYVLGRADMKKEILHGIRGMKGRITRSRLLEEIQSL